MKLAIALVFFIFSAAVAPAQTDTNLQYWVQNLGVTLTASTNGMLQTNGVVTRQASGSARLASKDLVNAISGQTAYIIAKGFTNWSVIITNKVPGPDTYTTNIYTSAYPVFHGVIAPVFSPSAKLLVMEPAGSNRFNAQMLFVVRDGNPAVDYVVNDYFQARHVAFDSRPEPQVVQGKFDTMHGLVATTETSINGLIFDANHFSAWPPPALYFDVQGATKEQKFSLIEGGLVVGGELTKSLVSSVAGTGQVGTNRTFAVMQGTVLFSGGKHEVR